jgi:hypothetical protein
MVEILNVPAAHTRCSLFNSLPGPASRPVPRPNFTPGASTSNHHPLNTPTVSCVPVLSCTLNLMVCAHPIYHVSHAIRDMAAVICQSIPRTLAAHVTLIPMSLLLFYLLHLPKLTHVIRTCMCTLLVSMS